MTIGLARELAGRKIRVNVIAPGGVETEGTITAGIIGSDFERTMIANTPLGRLGRPDDIAAVVMAVHDLSWMTGQIVDCDGGLSRHSPINPIGDRPSR